MRFFGPVIAFLLCLATPAAAEVMAVCGDLATQQASTAPVFKASTSVIPGNTTPAPKAQIALWRDAAGFDVLLNWGEQNQRSLRAEGADILGNELGAGLVHLVVARAQTPSLEHFLFSFEDSRLGELIWSAAKDASDEDSDMLTLESVCVRPE